MGRLTIDLISNAALNKFLPRTVTPLSPKEKAHCLDDTLRAGALMGWSRPLAYDFTAAGFLRRLLHAVLRWQKLYIVVLNVTAADPDAHSQLQSGESAIQCDVLETKNALFALKSEFPRSFRDSIDRLAGRLDNGCIIFVLRTGDAPSERRQIVGYSICQPGVFSAFGSVRRISSDIIFGHYLEFLPEYRGQGLKAVLDENRIQYCRRHGLRTICGVIASDNMASLKASLRSGFKIVGALRRVSILGGLFVCRTSWETVEKALKGKLS